MHALLTRLETDDIGNKHLDRQGGLEFGVLNTRQTVSVLVISTLLWATAACTSNDSANEARPTGTPTAPVLQPGKPGEPNVVMTGGPVTPPTRAVDPDDTRLMQDMIRHHAQALQIIAAANGLTDPQVKAITARIQAAQQPEITTMAGMLAARGQAVPPEAQHPLMTPDADHRAMPGLASTQQLQALAKARGLAADRTFLTLMITHHEGALKMALEQRKNGTEDLVTELSDHIAVTQTAEIGHMREMLARLSKTS
jgi:uncharacterized protein (DUF305 family)